MRVSEVPGSVAGPGPDAAERSLVATSRVLVIDDDAALAEMLSLVLRNEGFDPIWCGHGDQALDAYRATRPDLVLLDVMLPGKNGMVICREIRAESPVPIVMLTARSDTADVVAGLEAGADDFIAKPFKAKELIARIKTRLRRSPQEATPAVLSIGDLVINVDGHSVRRGETFIQLTPLEFDLLLALARRPQQVFSREMLLEQVWGYHGAGADARLVNVHVQRLRTKIEVDHEHPEIVITVRGVGYKAGDAAEPPTDEPS
jgi:two-component system response regulator MtrA